MTRTTRIAQLAAILGTALLCHCSSEDSTNDSRPDASMATDGNTHDSQPVEVGTPTDARTEDVASLQDAGRCSSAGDGRTTVSFVNLCSNTISFRGSDIDGGDLAPGASVCRDVGSSTEPINAKRYWGFAGQDPGAGRTSLAEFTFNTDFQDFDWYNLSHVDAFNLPLEIFPVDAPDCRTLSCPHDLLAGCPAEGRYPPQGEPIACVSPDRDDPTNPVATYFEQGCADAYSWSGDDAASMAACAGEDYDIVFCPPTAQRATPSAAPRRRHLTRRTVWDWPASTRLAGAVRHFGVAHGRLCATEPGHGRYLGTR